VSYKKNSHPVDPVLSTLDSINLSLSLPSPIQSIEASVFPVQFDQHKEHIIEECPKTFHQQKLLLSLDSRKRELDGILSGEERRQLLLQGAKTKGALGRGCGRASL
jgi:hypothetical protein